MKVFVAADHNGYDMKKDVLLFLQQLGTEPVAIGSEEFDAEDDYPLIARDAVLEVLGSDDSDPRAILLCGSGQGVAIAANRFKGIRAIVVGDSTEAKIARNDDDANVLCLPARIMDGNGMLWQDIIETWVKTPFAAAPRYIRRINQLDELV